MNGQVVVTLGDERYRPMLNITSPRMQAYAARIGADFHFIGRRRYPDVNICYEKFQIGELLDQFERVIYLDGDILVREGTPSLFDLVPFGEFGAMDEAQHLNLWSEEAIRDQFAPYGWVGPWNGRHFNAGVMVLDQTHRQLFDNPVVTNQPYWDQPYFNVMVDRLGMPFRSLPPEFNYMVFHDYRGSPGLRERAYMLHFAGWGRPLVEKIAALSDELRSEAQRGRAPRA